MRVAIEGLYPVTVAGIGGDALRRALADGVRQEPFPAEIDLDISGYTETKYAYLDPATRHALASVCGAVTDAGWQEDLYTGLCIGTSQGCSVSMSKYLATLESKGGRFCSPFIFSHSYPNSPNAVIAMDMKLNGYNNCVVCGGLSGGVALGTACDQIALGRSKRIVAGGVDGAPVPAACFLALSDEGSVEPGRTPYGFIRSWVCGSGPVGEMISSVLDSAGEDGKDVGVAAGNVKSGLDAPFLSFDLVHGHGLAASMALDAALLCIGPSRQEKLAIVVRSGPSGAVCVMLLELGLSID